MQQEEEGVVAAEAVAAELEEVVATEVGVVMASLLLVAVETTAFQAAAILCVSSFS